MLLEILLNLRGLNPFMVEIKLSSRDGDSRALNT
jgi:hypothetical protein